MDPKEYGKALFLLTEERGTTERVYAEMKDVCTLLSENVPYLHLLDTPAIPPDEKIRLIDQAFSALDTDLRSFVKLLAERHSVYLTAAAYRAYAALYDETRGIERVEAVSTVAMSEAQKARLTKKLSALTGKTVILKNTVDPSLLGGCRLRYAGRQIDGSLATRLSEFEKAIAGVIVG